MEKKRNERRSRHNNTQHHSVLCVSMSHFPSPGCECCACVHACARVGEVITGSTANAVIAQKKVKNIIWGRCGRRMEEAQHVARHYGCVQQKAYIIPAICLPLPTPAPSPIKNPAQVTPSGSLCICRWPAYTTDSSCREESWRKQ